MTKQIYLFSATKAAHNANPNENHLTSSLRIVHPHKIRFHSYLDGTKKESFLEAEWKKRLEYNGSGVPVSFATYTAATSEVKSIQHSPLAPREWTIFISFFGVKMMRKKIIAKIKPTEKWSAYAYAHMCIEIVRRVRRRNHSAHTGVGECIFTDIYGSEQPRWLCGAMYSREMCSHFSKSRFHCVSK